MNTTQIYKPMVCANPTDRWLAEIRNDGWLIDRKRFDTELQAKEWADNYTGEEIAPAVLPAYVSMIKRWSDK